MYYRVHRKEKIYFHLMLAISLIVYVGLIFFITQLNKLLLYILLYGVFFYVLEFFMRLFAIGMIKGNAIRLNERQFPALYAILKEHAEKLQLTSIPEMYLLQGHGFLNAFATKFARKNFVILYSSILELAYEEQIEAVSFIIGHELGHIKRNHVGSLKSLLIFPAKMVPFLAKAYSRACEYTCDAIGYSLCPEGAVDGILLLAAGKKLSQHVDIYQLESKGFLISFAEVFSTHPALIRRLKVLQRYRQKDVQMSDQMHVSPRVSSEQIEQQQ